MWPACFCRVAGLPWPACRAARIIFITSPWLKWRRLEICFAVLLHLDLESWTTFGIALGFTLAGAAIFSVTGKTASQIRRKPSLAFLMCRRAQSCCQPRAEATKNQKHARGNILLVTPRRFGALRLFAAVGSSISPAQKFLLVSFDRDGLPKRFGRALWIPFLSYSAGRDQFRSHPAFCSSSVISCAGGLRNHPCHVLVVVCSSLGHALIGGIAVCFSPSGGTCHRAQRFVCTFARCCRQYLQSASRSIA